MKSIRAIFLVCLIATLSHARVARAQAPTQPDAEKPHADCEELPGVAAKLATAEKTLQDWPNLARYRDANATVQPPAKGEKRVVFMGDSITDMWVQPQFGGFFPGKPYIDRGISGQTTPQMLIRFRPDVIALHPQVVVILAGTNDLAGNTGVLQRGHIDHVSAWERDVGCNPGAFLTQGFFGDLNDNFLAFF